MAHILYGMFSVSHPTTCRKNRIHLCHPKPSHQFMFNQKTTTQHQPSCLNDFLRKTYYDFMRTNSVYSYAKYKFHVVNIDMKRELLLLLWKRHMNAGKVYLTVPSLNHCVATYFLAFSQTIPETGQSCPQGKKDA